MVRVAVVAAICVLTARSACWGQDAEATPPLTPEASLAAIQTRPDFAVQLAAAEPLVMDPVAIDWGPDGRLWVVEMGDYPLGVDGKGKPGGRIRYLEDTDQDGQYDASTLFAEDLAFPTGVMAWGRGALVTAAPEILYLEDVDGDGRADVREVRFHGFREGNQQHRVNGFSWGLDNWVYLANGDSGGAVVSSKTQEAVSIDGRDLRLRPDTGQLDPQTGMTQFGRFRDDWGNWFGSNNSTPLRHYVLADHYLRRNARLVPPAPTRDLARSDNTQIFPRSRILSHWSGYQPPPPGTPHRFTSACGGTFYRDDLFGPSFESNAFICEPVHNLVHRRVVAPDGVSFSSRRAEDEQNDEFLTSSDSWFRPTSIRTGPDGALWVTDMYRLVIEHPEWIDDEAKQRLDLRAGHDRGRIYRIFPTGAKTRPFRPLDQLSSEQLAAALDSPNGWQRDTVQRLLVERRDESAAPLLVRLVASNDRPLTRLHALGALDGMGMLSEDCLLRALRDPHPAIRRHAVRLCEPFLGRSKAIEKELPKLIDDDDAQLGLQLAYSLGAWNDPRAGTALGRLALRRAGDAYQRAAILSSFTSITAGPALAAMVEQASRGDVDGELLTAAIAHAAAFGQSDAVADALDVAATPALTERQQAFQFSLFAQVDDAVRRESSRPTFKEPLRSKFRDLINDARSVAGRENAAIPNRIAAVELLGREASQSQEDLPALARLLTPQTADDLQAAALAALARINSRDAASAVLAGWEQYTPARRAAAGELMLGRRQWTDQLLAALESGEVGVELMEPAFRDRLLADKSESARIRSQALFAATQDVDRQSLIDRYLGEMTLLGDAERGAAVFAKHCAACHRIGNSGYDLGPDLTALADLSPRAIVTAVIDPNRAVEDKYRSYAAVTLDGVSHHGMLVSETSNSIVMEGLNKSRTIIPRADLERLHSTGKSWMPEGFEQYVNAIDMANLIAFVSASRQLPKAFKGNHPYRVIQQDDGTVRLPAAAAEVYGSTLTYDGDCLGYWGSRDDRAVWQFTTQRADRFDVFLDYACDDSTELNQFVLTVDGKTLRGRVNGTGGWGNYRRIAAGEVRLPAGEHRIAFRSVDEPDGYLIDLRSVVLESRRDDE